MTKPVKGSGEGPRRPPSLTREGRENQLIGLAVDRAEEMLMKPNPPTQVLVHYLKLATVRERSEMEKMELEKELLRSRTESLRAGTQQDERYERITRIFRGYQGLEVEDYDPDD